ncbi:MAG: type IV secretion system DNA-binding domain-containing protein [bacterium]|nr:type IV secretion system DNA-binding domain-containing protein [bacterium]
MTARQLFEIRTGRDTKKSAQDMMEFFSTLPSLRDNVFWQIIGKKETLSFEIVLENQTVTFFASAPERLGGYLKSLIGAHYPEATIKQAVDGDFLSFYDKKSPNSYLQQNLFPLATNLRLLNSQCFPLKDFREFGESDALASLLSRLSKANPQERAVVQFIITRGNENWKNSCQRLTSPDAATGASDPLVSLQKSLAESKIKEKSFLVNLNLLVAAPDRNQALLFQESLIDTLNAVKKEDSNQFKKRLQPFSTPHLIKKMQAREQQNAYGFHLTVYELATLYHFPNTTLATIPNLAWGKNLLGEPPANLPIVTRDSSPEIKKEINVFAETLYKNEVQRYGLRREDRRRHLYVIGKTGTGKSTLLSNMAINDLRNGEGLGFIDPHGDAIDILLDYIPANRINDVVYFNPADGERTVKINLFEGKNIEHRELIASGIVSIFQKLYSYSWGPRLEHFLRNALLTLLQMENARLSDIIELFTNKDFRKKVLEQLQDPVLRSFWEGEFEPLQDRLKNEAVAPILNKVGQFVSSPLVRNVVNADKSSFSIEQIMDEGKILLVNLSQGLLGEDNATLLGAMLITKIQLAAMARVNIPEEQRRDYYLYVDEFQNFATSSFNKILSEARKYRLNLTLANQYIAQIPEDVQKAIFGNCGSMISFVMGSSDAQVFAKEYGDKYSFDDLVSLDRHQIINRISINNILSSPFPAFTLPLAKSSNQNREKVIRVSRERYATKK